MDLFLETIKIEVLAQLPRVPSGTQHGRRCFVMSSMRKRNAT
jgi:hypothetical protein